MRAHLFVNPVSGRGRAKQVVPIVTSALEHRGVSVEATESREPGGAQEAARALGPAVDLAVVVGGDGTLHEVANGLAGRDLPVGLVPMGTGNVMAKEFGIPPDPARAAEVILARKTVRLDVGFAGERRFLLMAGVGFDGEVVRVLHASRKGAMRFSRYFLKGVQAVLSYGFPPFSLSIDGEPVARDVRMAVIGNTRSYGGPFEFTPRASPTDALFDVCALAGGGPKIRLARIADFLAFFYRAMRGAVREAPDVLHRVGRSVRVEGVSVPIQLDGEPAGTTPADFTLAPRAFTLIVP